MTEITARLSTVLAGRLLLVVVAVALSACEGAESEDAKRLRLSCDEGNTAACNDLGGLYESGEGVPQDFARAATLFKQACIHRPRSVATQRAGETLDDDVRRIGQVIERRPDTCPHCGGAVEVMPELTLAELLKIIGTLAEVVFSEPAVDEPLQVRVLAHPSHISSEPS